MYEIKNSYTGAVVFRSETAMTEAEARAEWLASWGRDPEAVTE